MGDHPQRVGRYRLIAPVGVGGMATVYLARQEGLGGFEREVALKLLHPHLAADSLARADFLEEARLAASVRHPNLVAVLDVGEAPPNVFLVMEYVEGDSLAALLSTGRSPGTGSTADSGGLPRAIALRVLLDALAGLHAAHELTDASGAPVGLVHRDFSPQNILVGIDGVGRLTDFGIAKATNRTGYTAPGLIKGKLRYMSPEQAQGKPLDRRSDVWAAGVVAWELMAGRRLFDDADEVRTILRILSGDPPRLPAEAGLPAAMTEAVAHALRRSPAARAATAAELRSEIAGAWSRGGQIASVEEVAAWVREHAGPAIAARRREALRGSSAEVDGETVVQSVRATPARRRDEAVARDPVTKTSSSADVRPMRAPSRRGPVAVAAMAAVTLIAVALVWRGAPASSPPADVQGSTATTVGSETSVATSVATSIATSTPSDSAAGPAPPASPASAGALPVALSVVADVDLVELRIGRRVVAIAPPASDVTLQLLAAERGVPVTLEARAVDGRRASTSVDAGVAEVSLAFAPRAAPASAAPRKAAAKPKRASPPPLPDSPYNAGPR